MQAIRTTEDNEENEDGFHRREHKERRDRKIGHGTTNSHLYTLIEDRMQELRDRRQETEVRGRKTDDSV